MSKFLEDVHARAKEGGPRRIIMPEGMDTSVREAAIHLEQSGLGKPILVHRVGDDTSEMEDAGLTRAPIEEGRAIELKKLLLDLHVRENGADVTPERAEELAHNPLVYGMYLLRLGEADALVAGKVATTAEVIRAGLWLIDKEPGIETVSSSFYMIVPPFRAGNTEEILTFADCGVVDNPTAEQLADIAIAAADARRFVVGDEPHVALVSFSTQGSGGDKSSSIQKIRKALVLVRAKRPDIKVEGEMQVDAALNEDISKRKMTGGSAIGHGKANVLVFPNLDAANSAYKLIEQTVPGARAIGPVLHGFHKIIHDLSRGAKVEDIVHSAAIAAVRRKQ